MSAPEADDDHRLSPGYVAIVVGLAVLAPGLSVAVQLATATHAASLMAVVGRWFVFWAVGVRLFTAGLRQVVNPAFTARAIFHTRSPEVLTVVRELGFANLSLGLVGVVSGFAPGWRMAAACAGGLFFAIAGIQHVIKRPAGPNEVVAMLSDLFIAAVMAVWLWTA